jgi:hypothetical protein
LREKAPNRPPTDTGHRGFLMKSVFLAYSFRDEDQELVTLVEHLLASHDVIAVTGEGVGGGEISPVVRARILGADGLIALLTRRDRLADGGWTTHDWVRHELTVAREAGKPAIGIFESGVPTGGPYGDNERIDLDRETISDALLRLSRTVGEWRRQAGRTLKVQILPDEVAMRVGEADGNVVCRYRFLSQGEWMDWRDARPIPEVGGTFVYIRGVRDDYLIQLQVDGQGSSWYSPATSQFLPITLLPKKVAP